MKHRHPEEPPTTAKNIEVQAVLDEIEHKNAPVRMIGLIMLTLVCIGVIAAVFLGAITYSNQRADRDAEARRREQQAQVGNTIIGDLYDRINNIDKNLAEHIGKEPLPPLVLPTTTTTVRRSKAATTLPSAASTRRTTTTTSRPATTTTAQPPPPSTTSSTVPPTTTTTRPQQTCVGTVCINNP